MKIRYIQKFYTLKSLILQKRNYLSQHLKIQEIQKILVTFLNFRNFFHNFTICSKINTLTRRRSGLQVTDCFQTFHKLHRHAEKNEFITMGVCQCGSRLFRKVILFHTHIQVLKLTQRAKISKKKKHVLNKPEVHRHTPVVQKLFLRCF